MRYENEPCCGCGGALLPETEDVVVCPDCGAPMHRRCWQAAGQCPLAGKHGGEFSWAPTIAPPEPETEEPKAPAPPQAVCPNCGEVCEEGATLCENCGTEFSAFEQSLRDAGAERLVALWQGVIDARWERDD